MLVSPDTSIAGEVRELLASTGALRIGHFILSSGLHSDRYCQCAALFEHPQAADRVAALMAGSLPQDLEPATVVAPALGGVVWGYALARALERRSIFAERGDDRAFALRRGFTLAPGERVLVAEDVVTTGGSVREVLALVRDLGAEPVGCAAVVDRSGGRAELGVPLFALAEMEFATWPADAVPPELAAIPVTKPGSRPSPKGESSR